MARFAQYASRSGAPGKLPAAPMTAIGKAAFATGGRGEVGRGAASGTSAFSRADRCPASGVGRGGVSGVRAEVPVRSGAPVDRSYAVRRVA